MNFWQQFAITQASAGLHALIRLYGLKYFTPAELEASDIVLDAVTQLPERIHAAEAVQAATHPMKPAAKSAKL
jgi:hypothetical protein